MPAPSLAVATSEPFLQLQGRKVSPVVPTVTGEQLVCLYDGMSSNQEVSKDVLARVYRDPTTSAGHRLDLAALGTLQPSASTSRID